MNKNYVTDNASRMSLEKFAQGVLDILEADDGVPFEEKKKAALDYLRQAESEPISKLLVDMAVADTFGDKTKAKFWEDGDSISEDSSLFLRKVSDEDRDNFLAVKQHYSFARSMFKQESYRTLLWNEHIQPKALMFSIFRDGEYIGYCGIGNTSLSPWEISIELLPDWTGKGMGHKAIMLMLNGIKSKLDIDEFRVRIDPFNYNSQALFEKLGASPNGISEFMLHDEDELRSCEDSNLHLIDDKLVAVSKKFGVTPRELLSHVLEYKLLWK